MLFWNSLAFSMIQFALAIWSLVPLPFLNLAFWNFFSQGYTVVVQSLSHVWHFVTPWTTAGQASLSLTISEFAQVHVHWIGDTIQPSHPLLSFSAFASIFPSIRVFSNELLFASGGQSIGASALTSNLPMNIQGWFPLGQIDLISLLSKGLSSVFFSTAIWKHQFFGAQPSLWPSTHICTWLQEKP